MNRAQELWWSQARADHELFVQLRRLGVHECHLLHYLQMATEKLSKAYFWRSGQAPPKSHTGLVRFLKALLLRRGDLDRIAAILGFGRREDLDHWVRGALTLAYSLQNLAPAEAGDGPNPEYSWPHDAPAESPIRHSFSLWIQLADTGRGRKLMEVVQRAIARFDEYA